MVRVLIVSLAFASMIAGFVREEQQHRAADVVIASSTH